MSEFDFKAHYKVAGYGGVAWYVTGYETYYGEDFEWTGEAEINTNRVVAIMVGDDYEYHFDIDELEKIAEDDFCRDCGQIGCPFNTYV